MKRWAIFECIPFEPDGGMGDFVAAFTTKEGAELYRNRNLNTKYWVIEDMAEYLEQPSPTLPSWREFAAEVEKNRLLGCKDDR